MNRLFAAVLVALASLISPVAAVAQEYRIPEWGGQTDWRRQLRNNPPLTERQWLEQSQPKPQPYCPPCRVIYVTAPSHYQVPIYGLYQNAFTGRLEFGWYLPR